MEREEILIFGASTAGKYALELLKMIDGYSPIGFIDNDVMKQNTFFQSLPIVSPIEAIQRNCKIFIASMYEEEIAEQLLNMGYKNFYKNEKAFFDDIPIDKKLKFLHEIKAPLNPHTAQKIGQYWSESTLKNQDPSLRESAFWHSNRIMSFIGGLIDKDLGENKTPLEAIKNIIKNSSKGKILEKAVSIGCGTGIAEMSLIQAGLVEEFLFYELSEERIKIGQQFAKENGLEDKVKFIKGDFYDFYKVGYFDLVYWSGALHHMFDVEKAIQWSYDVLKENGIFSMYEYVGPDRFQLSERSNEYINKVIDILPSKYRVAGITRWKLPKIANVYFTDPSEAADSANIIPALKKTFQSIDIIPLGGLIYSQVLSRIIHYFDETDEHDMGLLDALLLLDEAAIWGDGLECLYAAAIGVK